MTPKKKTAQKKLVRKPISKKKSVARKTASRVVTLGRTNQRSALIHDLRQLIHQAHKTAAIAVNVSLTMLYWRVGKRIREDVLASKRADYGEQIVATVSRQLMREYGEGFAEKNLRRMVQFAEAFPDEQIVATLWRQLSWSHFRELLSLKQPLQREFYAEMCRIEGWSVRTLSERIDSMLYERTALSKKPDKLIAKELTALRLQGEVTPSLVLKDPYVIDFLGLKDRYLERDLEDAILRGLESFLLELDESGIHVAEYLTVLPPKPILHQRLQAVIEAARVRHPASMEPS